MGGTSRNQTLQNFVERSIGPGTLALRTISVMERLPGDVLFSFLEDPRFTLSLFDYVSGKGTTVWMASPASGKGSRCVILKPQLADCREDFAHYIIAHELAHSHLRNGGFEDIHDPELAADALATRWGFSRPPNTSLKSPPMSA
jgi:hypothetical protein